MDWICLVSLASMMSKVDGGRVYCTFWPYIGVVHLCGICKIKYAKFDANLKIAYAPYITKYTLAILNLE